MNAPSRFNHADLVDILRDVCRLCDARSATLVVAGELAARWPGLQERAQVQIASTTFETTGGQQAHLRLFGPGGRTLSDVQRLLLQAYAAHARISLL
jgi:hypothetical protein